MGFSDSGKMREYLRLSVFIEAAIEARRDKMSPPQGGRARSME